MDPLSGAMFVKVRAFSDTLCAHRPPSDSAPAGPKTALGPRGDDVRLLSPGKLHQAGGIQIRIQAALFLNGNGSKHG